MYDEIRSNNQLSDQHNPSKIFTGLTVKVKAKPINTIGDTLITSSISPLPDNSHRGKIGMKIQIRYEIK
jgi:hypothetical protein